MEAWQIELQQSIRTIERLEQIFPVANVGQIRTALANMRLSITPHTASLIDFKNPNDPLFLISVPQAKELYVSPEELEDPIGDSQKSPVAFLTHRYFDRALVYTTFSCSNYCRFCFRRSKTGHANPGPSRKDIENIMAYLRSHNEINEVILSGGDPFTLLDEQIEEWLALLRAIHSIKRIRFHTRVPVNLPSRITAKLVETLRRYQDPTHPIFIVTHFNHPREIAIQNIEAIARLVDAGIVVRNQSVLLQGVNDDAATLEKLFTTLTDIRVVPYYLHQLDLAKGTGHFRVPIKKGIVLMRSLQGRTTGIALPRYMLDLPEGKGKIPLVHQFLHEKSDGSFLAEAPNGEMVPYIEP